METLEDLAIAPLAEFRTWLDENQRCERDGAEAKIGEIINKHAPNPDDILAYKDSDSMIGELLRFMSTKHHPNEAARELSGKARGVIGFTLWEEWRKENERRRTMAS